MEQSRALLDGGANVGRAAFLGAEQRRHRGGHPAGGSRPSNAASTCVRSPVPVPEAHHGHQRHHAQQVGAEAGGTGLPFNPRLGRDGFTWSSDSGVRCRC
jgi:hypothetical protein